MIPKSHMQILTSIDKATSHTLASLIALHPGLFQYKQITGLEYALFKLVADGLLELTGESYSLTQIGVATLDETRAPPKYQGEVAGIRESNVFAKSTGAIADHFAGMRRALASRLA